MSFYRFLAARYAVQMITTAAAESLSGGRSERRTKVLSREKTDSEKSGPSFS